MRDPTINPNQPPRHQVHQDHEAIPAGVESLARSVIGGAIAVHRALGPGYPESVYENALSLELDHLGIAHERQPPVEVFYRGERVGQGRMDLLVERSLVVELKSVDELHPRFTAQVLAYLQARRLRLGLLLNFNVAVMRDGVRRVVN